MLALAFFGPFNERWSGLTEMNRFETVGAAVLVAFIVWMGVWPAPFVDRISVSVLSLPGIS